MRIGQANINFDALTIHSPAGQFTMESKVMRVLEVLVDNKDEVLTRSDLIEAVWGVEFGGDERLSRAISLIRKALGDSRGEAKYIKTIPRRGYRFIAEVKTPQARETSVIEAATPKDTEVADINAEPIGGVDRTMPQTRKQVSPKRKPSKRLLGIASCVLIFAIATLLFPRFNSSLNPNSTSAQMEQAFENLKYYSRTNAIEDAQDIFSKILADDPDNAAARAGLSLALIRQYTDQESDPAILRRAKSAAEAALRSDSHLGIANVALGWSKEFEGDLQGALKSYDTASVLDPDNMFMLEGLARAYNKLAKPRDAAATLELAISLYPEAPIFYSYSGQMLDNLNDYENAEKKFRQLLHVSPENAIGYAQLAQTLHLQDRTSEAIQVLQDGLQIDNSALLYSNLGTYLFFQGQYDLAAEAFEKTLEREGNTHKYLYWANLADAYRFLPNHREDSIQAYDQAILLLKMELGTTPKDITLISRLAVYNAKRGNLDQARILLGQIPTNKEQSGSLNYRKLVIYELLSERGNALNMLEDALQSGYPLNEIKNDPELRNLRQDKNYHLLLAQEGAKNDSTK